MDLVTRIRISSDIYINDINDIYIYISSDLITMLIETYIYIKHSYYSLQCCKMRLSYQLQYMLCMRDGAIQLQTRGKLLRHNIAIFQA